MNSTELVWFKSTYSGGGGGNCVEVALTPQAVHVRDSKDCRIKPLAISPSAWAAFTARASNTGH